MERTKWTHREWAERDAADSRDAAAVEDHDTLRRQVAELSSRSDTLSEIEDVIERADPGYLHPDTGQSVADWIVDAAKATADNATLRRQVEVLREACEWYAEKSRYDNDIEIARGDGTYDRSCSVLEDEGAIARAALAATAATDGETGPGTAGEGESC